MERAAYVFCVLELFHQRLKQVTSLAVASSRWADPRAQLLIGVLEAWRSNRTGHTPLRPGVELKAPVEPLPGAVPQAGARAQ